jgi:hypothetical protein
VNTPVLNDGGQYICIESVQGATHSDHSEVSWVCDWTFLVNRSELGFFPRPGNACLCHEHVEKSSNVWSYDFKLKTGCKC